MHNGTISNNTTGNLGGGVSVMGTFTMHNGTISGNSATGNSGGGGGVHIDGGTAAFNMRGGTISGNSAHGWNGGGGIFVSGTAGGGTFRISGGTIYGSDAASGLANTSVVGGQASLRNIGTSQRGTFSNGSFTSLAALSNTNNTIEVIDGLRALYGTVSISGTAQVGQTLTADTNLLGGSGDITLQWMRGAVNVGTDSSTYIVQAADVGSTITVRATREDNHSSVTSLPTAAVISTPLVPEDFSISFADFTDMAPDIPIIGPAIRLVGAPTQAVINVANPGQYDTGSIRWIFDGRQITGGMVSGTNGGTFTLGPRIHGSTLGFGTHFLTVEVSINGVPFSRQMTFTVMQ